jgi:competence protein ComEC
LSIALAAHGPDILVARDSSTVAVRGSDGLLWLVRPAEDKYSADEWLKRDGDAREIASAVGSRAKGIHCDSYGCILRAHGGLNVAVVRRVDALYEDCAGADVVISAVPARGQCTGPRLVIDKFDVARSGGLAIWLREPLRILTVEGERGQRPWSFQQGARNRSHQYRRIRPTSFP